VNLSIKRDRQSIYLSRLQLSQAAARKDPAVHVSLSSDSIVKQQTVLKKQLSLISKRHKPQSRKLSPSPVGSNQASDKPRNSEKSHLRPPLSSSVAVDERLIGPTIPPCQHGNFKKCSHRSLSLYFNILRCYIPAYPKSFSSQTGSNSPEKEEKNF